MNFTDTNPRLWRADDVVNIPFVALRVSSAVLSLVLSIVLVIRIRSLRNADTGQRRYPRVHWIALECLGYADTLNALNYVGAAYFKLVLSTDMTDYYRTKGFPVAAHVLFPLGYFSCTCQLAFGACIPWLLYEHLFTFELRRVAVEKFMKRIGAGTLVLSTLIATALPIIILYPVVNPESAMTITTANGVTFDICFLSALIVGYLRLRNKVVAVLRLVSNDEDSRFLSILFRGFLYTIAYLVSWAPLNIIRFCGAVDLVDVSPGMRAILDVLGGSAGTINSLAFFIGEKAFPCVCDEAFHHDGSGSDSASSPYEKRQKATRNAYVPLQRSFVDSDTESDYKSFEYTPTQNNTVGLYSDDSAL